MLQALLIMVIILAALIVFYLWTIHPESHSRKQCLSFARWNFAHRGLWDMSRKIPENSLPAFQRAVDRGFAIELDVHLTKDGKIVVFHDDSLKRICQIDRTVESMTSGDLRKLHLLRTEQRIPYLSEVLSIINGKVPVLIELKLPGRDMSLCPALYDLLAKYSGPYLIESFNPFGLLWFRIHHPDIIRGQLSERYSSCDGVPMIFRLLSTSLIVNVLSRPHFIAYNFHHTDGIGFQLNYRLFHTPVFAWTIRNMDDFRSCRQKYETVIFEKCIPVAGGQCSDVK